MKKVLMIAYHYPPVGSSSGVHRTLKFSQYLLEFGWEPIILTVHPRVYSAVNHDQMRDIPGSVHVSRAFALDVAKHLSLFGSYPELIAMPDRWNTWWFGGVLEGWRLIRKYKPDIIWATYPIATAHLIGLTLSRLSGIPLVADYRDSMTEINYPENSTRRGVYRWIEKKVVRHSKMVIFTTPGTKNMYIDRYPNLDQKKWTVIENGFDEEKFEQVEARNRNKSNGKLVFTHSGLLYPLERNPVHFFEAISELKKCGDISAETLEIRLRASGNEEEYEKITKEKNIDDIISFLPSVSYSKALEEMLATDGLLLFQAKNCNHQIPAKIYEYIRARRPIFAMTDPSGDTANVLQTIGIGTISILDSQNDIKIKLKDFISQVQNKTAPVPDDVTVEKYSRRSGAEELARILGKAIAD